MTVNLEVPIEMLDTGISSSTGFATIFNHSKTMVSQYEAPNLSFDGTLTTTWEIIAENNHASIDYDLKLLDSTLTERASITIPANTGVTRYSTTFALISQTYIIQTPMTAVNANIKVYNARIRIAQAGATLTDISIPMLNNVATTLASGGDASVDNTTSATYTQAFADKYSRWTRDDSKWASYRADGDPVSGDRSHSLEVNLFRQGGSGSAFAKLINVTDSTEVDNTEVSTTSTVLVQLMAQFNTGDTNFDDEDDYEVMIKGSSSSEAKIAQARLRVRLTSLDKAEVYYRFHRGNATLMFADANLEYSRILVDTSLFDTPLVYHESTGHDHAAATPRDFTLGLQDEDTNDSGTAGSPVAASQFTWGTATKNNKRTSAFSIDSGDQFTFVADEAPAVSGLIYVTSSWLVVHCETGAPPVSGARRRGLRVI